jgi:ketosteroid isomerase-like protein
MLSMETDLGMLDKLNADYIRAVKDCDAGAVEALLAEDFVNSNPDGSLVDRAGFLAQIARPAPITNFRAEDVRIRLIGELAILHGRTRYTKADGTPAAGRYTDIWARRDGRWLCVAAHVTRG